MAQISRPKESPLKSYSKSTNMSSCGIFFTSANFHSLPRIEKKKFAMKFLEQKPIYDFNIWTKF